MYDVAQGSKLRISGTKHLVTAGVCIKKAKLNTALRIEISKRRGGPDEGNAL